MFLTRDSGGWRMAITDFQSGTRKSLADQQKNKATRDQRSPPPKKTQQTKAAFAKLLPIILQIYLQSLDPARHEC